MGRKIFLLKTFENSIIPSVSNSHKEIFVQLIIISGVESKKYLPIPPHQKAPKEIGLFLSKLALRLYFSNRILN